MLLVKRYRPQLRECEGDLRLCLVSLVSAFDVALLGLKGRYSLAVADKPRWEDQWRHKPRRGDTLQRVSPLRGLKSLGFSNPVPHGTSRGCDEPSALNAKSAAPKASAALQLRGKRRLPNVVF